MAAIGWKSKDGLVSFNCGGSLISELFVLTAAHCGLDADRVAPSFVRLGDQNLEILEEGSTEIDIPIDSFIAHERFQMDSLYHDIAVIKLKEQVNFNRYIRPACLWPNDTQFGSTVIATGWGYTRAGDIKSSDELRKVDLKVMSNARCRKVLQDVHLPNGISDSQICAGDSSNSGKDTCNGGKKLYCVQLNFNFKVLSQLRFWWPDSNKRRKQYLLISHSWNHVKRQLVMWTTKQPWNFHESLILP